MREKTEEDRGSDDVLGGRVGTGEGDAQEFKEKEFNFTYGAVRSRLEGRVG